jgi:hypothetical protein
MSVSLNYSISVSGSGLSVQSSIVRSASASIGLIESLPAAKTGTLSTRTDNTDGELTMAAGHGITTAAVIDLYWTVGGVMGVRYGVVVGTVATNAVPISGGAGDNLPIATTPITAVLPTTANVLIDGDNTKLLAIELKTTDTTLRTAGHVSFRDAANDLIAELDLVTNTPRVYDLEGGDANPFTGDVITYIQASNANSATAASLSILGVYDASP